MEDLRKHLLENGVELTIEALSLKIKALGYNPQEMTSADSRKVASKLLSGDVEVVGSELAIAPPQSDRQAQGLELRSQLESGQVDQSDLTLSQASLVLESIEFDEQMGEILTDVTVSTFYQLSDRLDKISNLTQIAQKVGEKVKVGDQKLINALDGLASQVNGNNKAMVAHLEDLNRKLRGGLSPEDFRTQQAKRRAILDSLTDSLGIVGTKEKTHGSH